MPRTQYLHVCFGTVALAATAAELQVFREAVAAQHHAAGRDPEARYITLRTPADKIALVFTWQELLQLRDILENTALLLEVKALLAME